MFNFLKSHIMPKLLLVAHNPSNRQVWWIYVKSWPSCYNCKVFSMAVLTLKSKFQSLTSQQLPVKFGSDDEHLCQIYWISELYLLRNYNKPTNQPTNLCDYNTSWQHWMAAVSVYTVCFTLLWKPSRHSSYKWSYNSYRLHPASNSRVKDLLRQMERTGPSFLWSK